MRLDRLCAAPELYGNFARASPLGDLDKNLDLSGTQLRERAPHVQRSVHGGPEPREIPDENNIVGIVSGKADERVFVECLHQKDEWSRRTNRARDAIDAPESWKGIRELRDNNISGELDEGSFHGVIAFNAMQHDPNAEGVDCPCYTIREIRPLPEQRDSQQ